MENYLNFYTIFRLALLGSTIFGTVQLIKNLLRYKPYYDKIPQSVKSFLFRKGGVLLERKLRQHKQDFLLNGLLLIILIFFNITLFFFT